MEKAIEIKRRAQRCLQSGDLDGALSEYEKLTRAEDSEPINFVLMADLLFKKGAAADAGQCYLRAVDAYGKAGLYKNAIAVCKKMARLSLAPTVVLQRLAELHALDGLRTEAALYYQEYADHQAHEEKFKDAAESARRAFEATPDNVRLLERASGWLETAGDARAAAAALAEAARHYAERGQEDDAERARTRARELDPESGGEHEPASSDSDGTAEAVLPAPGILDDVESAPAFEPSLAAPAFEPPLAAPAFEPSLEEERPAAEEEPAGLAEIEGLLKQAAERFQRGDREQASDSLVRAARAYEAVQRLESAAAIYRSLGRTAHASPEVMGLWLRNCELRGDSIEAAEVACALGDRSLTEDDTDSAREWFARALRHVPDHETAKRRLQRIGPRTPPQTAPGTNGGKVPGASEGRVEVAVGRAQAVTLDLGSLIAEFQQGIESQLSDDVQSHYDLGMTYREMGLFDQAVECFRVASRSPDFTERTAEMIGRCLLDQGRFDEAVEEFRRALEALGDQPLAGIGLRYQLGLAQEVAGHVPEALAEFERVYAEQPNYPDVAQKIRVLRRALESV